MFEGNKEWKISIGYSSCLGVPQIEVTFDIDANGILNVTLKISHRKDRILKLKTLLDFLRGN